MAGNFDLPTARDVLTSLLNGVGPYKEVELDAEERKQRKRERKEAKRAARAALEASGSNAMVSYSATAPPAPATSSTTITVTTSNPTTTAMPRIIHLKSSSFWKSKSTTHTQSRPEIMIASVQRSVSVTPPPMSLQPTPECTPGPSVSSATSHESLKRLHTPGDDEDIDHRHVTISAPPRPPKERKKRVAARKGWKGWIEGSPPPSEKLINLDAVPILQERRTRSGKNFDGIGEGKDGWV
ncbi:hypothetical protein FA13DRAFT_1740107 [Coprinellus micaceus]|uniref:Uncharacterized protein n=1 Tax=Coprinellus micaceus TaxID=71717 RepID=A0A4Y7SN95_COPMI|nr:hypothetical protein FA13DRAFT_1740107 [Coprinellus micaceus]